MAKRTKSQRNRAIKSIDSKAKALYMEGILSTKCINDISRICKKALMTNAKK